MTDFLERTLHERADRIGRVDDSAAILATVQERAAQRSARRRVAIGAGAGSVVAVGAIVTAVVVTNLVGAGHNATAVGSPVASITAKPSPHAITSAPARKTSLPPTGARLVTIPAATKKAPLSLRLAPEGWKYLGYNEANTLYGPAKSDHDSDSFVGKLVAMVGERRAGETFPIRVAGFPARVNLAQHPAQWSVDIAYNSKIMITVQVWTNAHLSRTQVLRVANTLQIRDVSHPASG